MLWKEEYSSPLGPNSFPPPLNFHFTIVLSLSFPFLYYLPISSPFPSFLSLPFPFLYYLPISSPFPSFPPLFFIDFSALPVLFGHFSSCPFLPQFSTETLHPPFWISVLLNCLLFSSPSSLRFFLCPSVHIIMFLALQSLQVVIYHGVATGLRLLPPPLFCFILLFINLLLYWFLLICSLF